MPSWQRWFAILAVGLPAAASAQTVTNLRTGAQSTTLTAAIGAAAAGDTLELDGDLTDTVTVDRDITVVGAPGAVLRSGGAAVFTLDPSVSLTVSDVDLVGTGATRAIAAEGGGNTVVVQDATIDARYGAVSGINGGAVILIDAASASFERVTFVGVPGLPQAELGGAVYAYTVNLAPLSFVDVTFDRIEATGSGGAVWSGGMSTTCIRCVFDHTDGAFGGALYAADGPLYVEQSLFCASSGGLGGALFASGDTDVRSTVFSENSAFSHGGAVYVNGAHWTLINNHFLGNTGTSAVFASALADTVTLTNNLFLGHTGLVLSLPAGAGPSTSYNWFHDNTTDTNWPLDATDIVGAGDPDVVLWTRDGDCTNDVLYPTPIMSPLLDAGDPALADPDGSRSDIGAFGGLEADPDLHTDHDGDGPPFLHDCDDYDATDFPGNDEVCDAADNDCDDVVDEEPIDIDTFFADCDLDGQGAGVGVVQCFPPAPPGCGGGWASSNELGAVAWADCDDGDDEVYDGATELCDLVDRDCDGDPVADAVDASTYYEDTDGDGYGTTEFQECADKPPLGAALVPGDCQDQDDTVFPGAYDPCGDGIDQNCNGTDGEDAVIRTWYPDEDGDGYGDATADPVLDCRDGAGAAMVEDATDCDDARADVFPGATEVCNLADDDCDGRVDDVGDPQTWYRDADGDGFGDPNSALDAACSPGAEWIGTPGDCDDTDPAYTTDCPTGPVGTDPVPVESIEEKPEPTGCGCAAPGGGPGGAGWIAVVGAIAVGRMRRRSR